MSTTSPKNRVLVSAWLKQQGYTSAQLEVASNISRQSMTAIRAGRDIRMSTMVKILGGARLLSRRQVAIEELFDFDNPVDVENVIVDDASSLR